jgi:hypothetical protein
MLDKTSTPPDDNEHADEMRPRKKDITNKRVAAYSAAALAGVAGLFTAADMANTANVENALNRGVHIGKQQRDDELQTEKDRRERERSRRAKEQDPEKYYAIIKEWAALEDEAKPLLAALDNPKEDSLRAKQRLEEIVFKLKDLAWQLEKLEHAHKIAEIQRLQDKNR